MQKYVTSARSGISPACGAAAWIATEGSRAVSLPRLVKVAAGRAASGPGWLGFKANGAYRVLSVKAEPLFATLLGLGALLLAFCAMWFREGR